MIRSLLIAFLAMASTSIAFERTELMQAGFQGIKKFHSISHQSVELNGKLYFVASTDKPSTPSTCLWSSDGSPQNTVCIFTFPQADRYNSVLSAIVIRVGNKVLAQYDGTTAFSDGTKLGTNLLYGRFGEKLGKIVYSSPSNKVVALVSYYEYAGRFELWRLTETSLDWITYDRRIIPTVVLGEKVIFNVASTLPTRWYTADEKLRISPLKWDGSPLDLVNGLNAPVGGRVYFTGSQRQLVYYDGKDVEYVPLSNQLAPRVYKGFDVGGVFHYAGFFSNDNTSLLFRLKPEDNELSFIRRLPFEFLTSGVVSEPSRFFYTETDRETKLKQLYSYDSGLLNAVPKRVMALDKITDYTSLEGVKINGRLFFSAGYRGAWKVFTTDGVESFRVGRLVSDANFDVLPYANLKNQLIVRMGRSATTLGRLCTRCPEYRTNQTITWVPKENQKSYGVVIKDSQNRAVWGPYYVYDHNLSLKRLGLPKGQEYFIGVAAPSERYEFISVDYQ